MVHICQISLITLSVLSNYLFLYICSEYLMHLCQNIRGGGEKVIISFLWKSFFPCFLSLKDKQAGCGCGKDWLGWTWGWFCFSPANFCGSALIHWGNWLDQTPTRNVHAPPLPRLVPQRPLPASPALAQLVTTPGAEGTQCHHNRSQRPLLLLLLNADEGMAGGVPFQKPGIALLNIWSVRRTLLVDVLLVTQDFGKSSGWVWTAAVLCSTAQAALEAFRCLIC